MEWPVVANSVRDARDQILDCVSRNKDKRVFYFHGWNGFGAASVLRSIAQYAVSSMTDNNSPPELQFGRTIYLDCSRWKSKRVMQRRIAEELKFDHMIMAMFDKQDEVDDFNGVDPGSRDVIRSVAAEIDQTLRKSRYLMVFLNGSNGEIPLSRFGIPEYHDGVVIWVFNEKFPKMYSSITPDLIRYTDVLVSCMWSMFLGTSDDFTSSQFSAVFQEEAASIAPRCPCIQGIDLTTVVIDCCLYGLFLKRSFQSTTTGFCWAPHDASNYWICQGIINIGGDRAWEIAAQLHAEISFDCKDSLVDMVLKNTDENIIKLHPNTPYWAIKHEDYFGDVYEKRPYRWVSITPSNSWKYWQESTPKNNKTIWKDKKSQEDMQIILAGATTIFVAFESTNAPHELPNGLFEPCKNLSVLILYCCALSFVSPPFLQCNTLRFLGLDHCTDDNSTSQLEGEDCTSKWRIFLHSLWVLDLRYTHWDDILSKKRLNLMVNLTELNMEGVRCWQYTDQLQEMLPYLQRLRIMKTTRQEEKNTAGHQEETSSMDMRTSLADTSKLQLLDLSGNSHMEKLPTGLSKASCSLEVLVLDGCAGLQDVVLPNFLLLRTFSFDGYGPATSNWTSATELIPTESCRPNSPPDANREHRVKTSTISLEGCRQLENLFLRGLVNLVELDLSGCAVKILDFKRMVVNVPRLKRLFLLGCEHLRAIIFGSDIVKVKCK